MIEFRCVDKVFGDGADAVTAVRDLNLAVADGEIHALIGTSGCGKTTTLRMVNRLEDPTRGEVLLDGIDVRRQDVFALRRRIGYVIQAGGLFPHLTVAGNVGLLCELEAWPPNKVTERVAELLELVGLPSEQYGERYPADLSGGQRQRVGVARALALDPDYVLMDELFGALDPITRTQIQDEFEGLFRSVRKTILLVTHDLAEAFRLADRVSVMHEGRLLQTGTKRELVEAPATPFVARFLEGHASVPVDVSERRDSIEEQAP